MIKNLKDTYTLRSKFVHHGHSIAQLETVREFMRNAWELFICLAKDNHRFSTKEQLIDYLEARKLS